MAEMNSLIQLPIATIQPDFESVISDIHNGAISDESFWLSCYKTGETSVHGKVHTTLDQRNRDLVRFDARDGVDFKQVRDHVYTAACPGLGIPHTRMMVPARTFTDPLPPSQGITGQYRKIVAFDIAPDGSQFATGYDDGSVYIIPTSSTNPPTWTTSKPHLSTITSLRFFPSSRVVLTSAADFSMSILPADLPSSSSSPPPPPPSNTTPGPTAIRVTPARIFKGHSRAITSTAIVSRGRNVLSGSKDGTVRLWDVSSGNQIRVMASAGFVPVLALSLGERGEGAFAPPPHGEEEPMSVQPDEKEVDTSDKIVFCALQDGSFEAIDLGAKRSVFHSKSSTSSTQTTTRGARPPLSSIAYSSTHSLVATGSTTGVVNIYDTRSLRADSPVTSFVRNSASIEDLVFLSPLSSSSSPSSSPPLGTNDEEVRLAVATEDGLPFLVSVRPEGPIVQVELVGIDCDAVRCVRTRRAPLTNLGEVWAAGDDGVVRKYEV